MPAPEGATLAEVTRDGQRNLRRAYGRNAVRQAPVEDELAGVPALRFDYDLKESRVRQVGAMRGGSFYLVSFTAAKPAFERRLTAFEAFLRSWRWE